MHPRPGTPPLNVRVCHQMSAARPPYPAPCSFPKDGSCPALGTGTYRLEHPGSSGQGHTFSRGQGLVDSGPSSSESLSTMGLLFHANARLETGCIFCFC